MDRLYFASERTVPVTETTTETAAPQFQNEFHKAAYDQLAGFISQRNELVAMANAASGDRVTLKEQLTENSTDPEVVAAREARDEAIERLEALVNPQVEQILANSSGELASIEEKIKTIDSTLKPGVTFFKKVYGDAAAEALPSQARLKGLKIGSSGGGGRRIRGYVVDVTVDGEPMRLENFAAAAKYLDVETSSLQDAFFAAAGNPKQLKDAPDEVSFEVTFTEVDDEGNKSENTAEVVATRTEPTGNDEATEPEGEDAEVTDEDAADEE